MLLKIKKAFGTDLIKVSFLNAVSTLIRMLTGFVSVKVIASVIGPVGIALLGQLNNFSAIFLSISNGGINAGVTKYTAEYSNSEKKYTLFLSTGLWITFVLSVVCGLVLLIGAGYFSVTILKDIQYRAVFYIFGGTIILYALHTLLISILNGFKEYKKYVIVNILGSLIGLLFSVVLALNYGIYGALISAVTYQSVVFIVTLYLIHNAKWFKWKNFFRKFSKTAAIKLGHYSLMALVSAIAVPASQLIVRGYITQHMSIDGAGIWEGMNRISSMYLTVITTSLSVYYLPRLVELKTDQEIRKEIFTVYKVVIPFLLVVSLMIFGFRSLIVHILFTDKFSSMKNLFAFQLLGDFLKITSWILGYLLIAKAMTKMYIIMELANSTLFVVISLAFIKMYGSLGATIGYAIGYFVYLVCMIVIFRKIIFDYE